MRSFLYLLVVVFLFSSAKGETSNSANAVTKGNLKVRVEEASKKPKNLVIKLLGGPAEVVAVEISEVNSSSWDIMREHGAVWATSTAPPGDLLLVFRVKSPGSTGSYDDKVVWSTKAIPANWKVGSIYDTGVQITGI